MKTAQALTYKRKVAIRDGKEIPEIARGIWSPSVRHWHELLEDMVSIAKRRRDNKFAQLRLQLSILGDIVTTEKALVQYVTLINNPEEARKWIPEPEPIDQINIDHWNKEVNANKILLAALRDIGDGIAWRVLQHNRPLLYTMSRNEASGTIQLDEGRLNELYELSDITTDPTITHFFLHAITNFARVGDITSVDQDGQVEFAEVKSKSNPRGKKWKERVERQILRLDNLTKLANEGIGLVDDKGVVVKMINATPKLSLKGIRSLLREAQASGAASQLLHPYLAITAADFGAKLKEETFERAYTSISAAIREKGDIIVHPNSLHFFEFSPNRAPISIHPFEASSIAGILLGRIVLFYHFNVSRFFRELAREGWPVVDPGLLTHPKDYNPKTDPFCVIKKGKLTIAVPPSMIARVVFEGISVKSLLLIFDAIRLAGAFGREEPMIYGFSGEAQLWE
jgi:hypothetical protein